MRISILLLLYFFSFSLIAQESYSKVRVFVSDEQINDLLVLGVPLDHGMRKKGVFIETDLSESEISVLDIQNINYQIIIKDVQAYYKDLNMNAGMVNKSSRTACDNFQSQLWSKYSAPQNFNLGSMAGYFTYQQFLDQIDSMSAKYPNLITAKAPISTFLTHEGRPIYFLRISDNPGIDEGEPQVLFTSIHHAREPGSLSQLIFFMWHLLENYGSDPEITFLVDHTDMFFVPMLNPDGYIHNEVNNPGGGGMHRKNKSPDGTTNPGVDLNRNYDYQWGTSGVSANQNHDTYPGGSAFSEPETQAIKWLCENQQFLFSSNAHTYGDLLLYPYGWDNTAVAPDEDYYVAYTQHMVMENSYANIKSSDLYPASGGSDDWMYMGDLATKPSIFSLTPEIGYAFWAASNDIIDICKKNIFQNKAMAHLPHNFATIRDLNNYRITSVSGHLKYETQRLGQTAGDFTVTLIPLEGFSTNGLGNLHSGLNILDEEVDSVSYSLLPNINFGDTIKYIWETDFGLWQRKDTLIKIYGIPNIQLFDPADDMNNWSSSSWDITNEDFVSSPTSITDSPFSNYSNNSVSEIFLLNEIDLTYASEALVSFHSKWEIEKGYDYAQLMASADNGGSWIPLCGKYTVNGNSNQDEGKPLYDGFQTSWVMEEVELADFLGQKVQLKFRLVSDFWVNEDGFYFDDFKVFINYLEDANISSHKENIFKVYPNPSNGIFFVNIPSRDETINLLVFDASGKTVFENEITQNSMGFELNLEFLQSGTYTMLIKDVDDASYYRKVVIY